MKILTFAGSCNWPWATGSPPVKTRILQPITRWN